MVSLNSGNSYYEDNERENHAYKIKSQDLFQMECDYWLGIIADQ